MNRIHLGLIYKDRSSDVAHWLQLFFVWTVISTSERSSDAFTDDIMLNNPPF